MGLMDPGEKWNMRRLHRTSSWRVLRSERGSCRPNPRRCSSVAKRAVTIVSSLGKVELFRKSCEFQFGTIVNLCVPVSFADAEIHTYSTSGNVLPRAIYRENWLKFSSIQSGQDGLPTRYQFRVTVDAAAPGQGIDTEFDQPLTYALQSHLDLHDSMPIIPALPNGAGRETSHWHSPIGAFVHAKDIVRMRRKDSSQTNTSVTPGTTPASYGDGLAVKDGLFEAGGAGMHEPDEMTTGSTSGDTRDDEWDDDLVTGVMDDELHHRAEARGGAKT